MGLASSPIPSGRPTEPPKKGGRRSEIVERLSKRRGRRENRTG
jgi:hypothetical protein